eukprot:6173715-Pleurochrysis_carterae.AAC.1
MALAKLQLSSNWMGILSCVLLKMRLKKLNARPAPRLMQVESAVSVRRLLNNESHILIYSNSTEQPLKGRARFEAVARTNSFNHARLSWRALLI